MRHAYLDKESGCQSALRGWCWPWIRLSDIKEPEYQSLRLAILGFSMGGGKVTENSGMVECGY
jgi:hypothetical protein